MFLHATCEKGQCLSHSKEHLHLAQVKIWSHKEYQVPDCLSERLQNLNPIGQENLLEQRDDEFCTPAFKTVGLKIASKCCHRDHIRCWLRLP